MRTSRSFILRLIFPTIATLLCSETWNTPVLVVATSTSATTLALPVFRANIKHVPGLRSGINAVVYLYGVGSNHEAAGDDAESGGPKTAYAGYIFGLGGCTSEKACTITVSPGTICLHYTSRAPEYFHPAWANENLWSNNEEIEVA
jgi:hypothetical protein